VAEIRHGRNQDLRRRTSRSGGARILILLLPKGCLIFRWELVLKALRAHIPIPCLKEYKGMGHRAWRVITGAGGRGVGGGGDGWYLVW
jgi:hypothetical protein